MVYPYLFYGNVKFFVTGQSPIFQGRKLIGCRKSERKNNHERCNDSWTAIEQLKKFDPWLPVVGETWVDRHPYDNNGTDMSGKDACKFIGPRGGKVKTSERGKKSIDVVLLEIDNFETY